MDRSSCSARPKSLAVAAAAAALILGACASADPLRSPAPGLQLIHADETTGVLAVYVGEGERLTLRAWRDGELVRSHILDERGHAITELVVPIGSQQQVASELGRLARRHAQARSGPGAAAADPAMAPLYAQALKALHLETEALGDSTLRYALLWNEEVLLRAQLGGDGEEDIGELDAPCEHAGSPVHTRLVHLPELNRAVEKTPRDLADSGGGGGGGWADEEKCDLNCSWYDVCCHHDEACWKCDHWWCGWSCVKGCWGGDCGGGR